MYIFCHVTNYILPNKPYTTRPTPNALHSTLHSTLYTLHTRLQHKKRKKLTVVMLYNLYLRMCMFTFTFDFLK